MSNKQINVTFSGKD